MIGFAVLVTAVSFGCYLQKGNVADFMESVGAVTPESMKPAASMAAAERYPDQILWKDFPVRDYLGRYIDDVMEELDEYMEDSDENICAYREIGIIFYFDDRRKVYSMVIDPALCTYNGEALNVKRDKILEILGAPFLMGWTEWGEDVPEEYFIDYYDGEEGVRIYMPSPEEAATDIYID